MLFFFKFIPKGAGCVDAVRTASAQLTDLFKKGNGPAKVKELFNTCTAPESDVDISNFASEVIGNFQGATQYYGRPNFPSLKTMCDMMVNGRSANPNPSSPSKSSLLAYIFHRVDSHLASELHLSATLL